MHTAPMTPQTPAGPLHRLRHRDRDADEAPVLDLGRMLIGLVIVSLGVLFLLDAANALNASRAIDRWWPTVIIAGGLLTLAERPPAIPRGLILTAIGTFLLLTTTNVLGESAWDYAWPVVLIVAGLAVLVRWSGHTIPAGTHPEDVIRSTAMFGGSDLSSADQRFRGAWLTAIFGGITLDLREARPHPDGASINATAAFGGVDILVPHGWRISVRSVPIFGGVEDKTDHAQPPADDAPVLHIDAVGVFGGVGIKHEK